MSVVLYAILYYALKPEPPKPIYLQDTPDGVRELYEPRELIDFTFNSTLGRPVSLSDFRGNMILLYFGYTHCPDICPITLGEIKRTHDFLGEDADQVQVIFVSVDGERDTPQRIADYFLPFGVSDYAVGLQGEDIVLQRIAADYSLYYELHKDEGENYTVDHTSTMFLINEAGELDTIFSFGTNPEVIAEHIRSRLQS